MKRDKKKLILSISTLVAVCIIGFVFYNFYFKKSISSHSYVDPLGDFGIDPPAGWKNNLVLAGTSTASSTLNYLSLGIPAIFQIASTTPKLFQNTDPVVFVTDRPIVKDSKIKDPADVSSPSEYAAKVKNNFVPLALQPALNYKLIEDQPVTLKDGTAAYLIGNSFDSTVQIFPDPVAIPLTQPKSSKDFIMPKSSEVTLHYRGLYLIVIKKENLYIVSATADQSKWGDYSESFMQTLLNFQPKNT